MNVTASAIRQGLANAWPLAALWLLALVLVAGILWSVTSFHTQYEVKKSVSVYLVEAMDERLFSDTNGRVNNIDAIRAIGLRINQHLARLFNTQGLAMQTSCSVVLSDIDGIDLQAPSRLKSRTLELTFIRNLSERRATAVLACQPNYVALVWIGGALAIGFALLYACGVRPLRPGQRAWFEYLLLGGYSSLRARRLLAAYSDDELGLSDIQWRCFEHMHSSKQRNASDVLAFITRPVMRSLSPLDAAWLQQGLVWFEGDFDRALALAQQSDTVSIDLEQVTLSIRGVDIPVTKTPLFYLAWYARARLAGQGWLSNPASNRPDMQQGKELAAFMWQHKGHAKAIDDLEAHGLKAKTLDQNRSKIKDEICAVLGDELGAHYLFEADKDAAAGRSRYRLKVAGSHIVLRQ